MKKIILSVLALLLFCLAGCKDQTGTVPRRKAPPREMVLAAGQTVGGYGSLGGDLVNLVNQDGKQPPLKAADSTGSLANLELLRQEKADLALVQSDAAWYARTGTGPYEGRPIEDLEQVGTLMPETVQIITYDLTGIRKLQDLKGKTVSVGAPGSGSALNARQLLEAAGIAEDDVRIQYLTVEDTVRALKEGTVDAAILTSSLPHPALKDLARQRRLVLVPVEGQDLDDLVAAYPLYQPVTIPVGTYPNQTRPCASVALQCLLVTRQRVDQEQVRNFLARIWPHWQELKAGHPVLPVDLKKRFFQDPLLPLAPGAEQFQKDSQSGS